MLETTHLLLREWKPEDLQPFIQANADPRVMQYYPKTMTALETAEMVGKIQEKFNKFGFGLLPVKLKKLRNSSGISASMCRTGKLLLRLV